LTERCPLFPEAIMSKSPGHQRAPNHKVQEDHLDSRVRVEVAGELVAESEDVIQVNEDGSPARYYFPRSDVKMEKLQQSQTTTHCPFKGTARYFNLTVGGRELKDAIWTYEEPYDEHVGLKDRLAFYDEKIPALQIRTDA
jgi:uncharacterized protein (DUF427 family)